MSFPVGTHRVRVADHALGKTSTGKEQIAICFEGDDYGRIWWYGYFTEKALATTLRALENVGWEADLNDHDIRVLDGGGMLVGNEAEIVVEMEADQKGEMRARVRWVNSPGGGGVATRLEGGEKDSFAANLRKRIIAAKGPKASRAPASAQRPNTPPEPAESLDDVPF